ncbi:MAG: T9SS type A sorting domain-containing protein, partial [bacterium]
PLVLEKDIFLTSANIWLNYDQTVLELVDITKSPAFEKFHLFYNDLGPGEIKIALFGIEPVKGEQEFLTLHFNYVSPQQQDTKIHYEYWCINNIEYSKNDVIIQTGIDDNVRTELDFKLRSNYPNPFNPETTINYHIEKNGQVRLVIYNSQGRIVRCLVDRYQNRGKYAVQWNGLDDSGKPVGSGLYFCRLSSGNKIQVIKMVKLK